MQNNPHPKETHCWVASFALLHWKEGNLLSVLTHSSILAWRIPWTEEPGRLQFMESQRIGQSWGTITHSLQSLWIIHFKLWGMWQLKVKVLITLSCLSLWDPMDCDPPGSSVHGVIWARTLEEVITPFSGESSWPRDWTPVSCNAGGFFTVRATGEAVKKNTGVGSHSLFQGIFPTRESKLPLPHCRQILYHLSHKGSPYIYNASLGASMHFGI